MAVYLFLNELRFQFNLLDSIPQRAIILTCFVNNLLEIDDVLGLDFIEHWFHLGFSIFDDLFPLQSIDCPCEMLIDHVRAVNQFII